MMKKTPLFTLLLFVTALIHAQNITFSFANAQNTNDGVDDFYEVDVMIQSDTEFALGSGLLYFNYNTEAFGTNIGANNNVEYERPVGSILDANLGGSPFTTYIYSSFIDNDNTDSRWAPSFQQNIEEDFMPAICTIVNTPTLLFHIKIKYLDKTKDPMFSFEEGAVFLDQLYTACGNSGGDGSANCNTDPGMQILNDSFDSTNASTEVTWTGLTSTDWAIGSNWNGDALPATTKDIIIPNVVTTPIIGSGTSVQMNDLTVETGASFGISEEGAVTVNGDFTTNGAVSLTSTNANSGVFIVKGTSNGTITYERGGLLANEWSTISAPVSGQSIKEFVENAANDIRVNTTVNPHRYAVGYYDDSQADGSKWIYYTATDLVTNALQFEEGKGYAISRATNGAVTFTGSLGTTSITETVTASTWNAIGNPYTAFLPINENGDVNFINDNIGKFDDSYVGLYVWDNTQNKYVGKSLVSGESALAPGQGFFMKTTTGVTNVTFNEARRKTQAATGGVFSKGTGIKQIPSIQLLATSKGVTVDTNIKYYNTASEGLDPGYDLGNHASASFDVFTRLLDSKVTEDFTIQSLPNSGYERMIIPIGIKSDAGNEISFIVKSLHLPEGMEVFIEDKELNTITKVGVENQGTYNVSISEKVNGAGRFYVHTKLSKLSINTEVTAANEVQIYNSTNNELVVNGISKGNFELELYNVLGVSILKRTVEANGKNKISLPALETGVYIVSIDSNLGVNSKKIMIK